MKVLKFGGTSVGSVEAIESVKRIVEGRQEPVIVVVSAFSGVTDQLYKLSRAASQGDEGYLIEYEQMYARHLTVIDRMVPAAHKAEVLPQVQDKFADLLNILKGLSLIRDLSPRILDTVVGYGEMLSSLILSHVIEGAVHQDSTSFIKTTVQFDKHVVDYPATEERVRRAFQPLPPVSVCGGFIASDLHTGRVTNLGRGGSDYTASILAATLGADSLEIWTDVDGFMTADPRIIPNAYVIERLSFGSSIRPPSSPCTTATSRYASRTRSTRRPRARTSPTSATTAPTGPSKASRPSTTHRSSPCGGWAWWGSSG